MPISIGDFTILPISIPPLPSFPVATVHYIYIRQNNTRSPTDDDFRTLFFANVPSDSTEMHFRALFATMIGAGKFASITFEADRKAAEPAVSTEPAQAARLASIGKKRKREEEAERAREEEAAKLPDSWTRKLRKSGSTATVQLVDERSVDLVFKAISKAHKTKKYPVWGDGVGDKVPSLGEAWLKSHNKLSYPEISQVEESVDMFFTLFNQKEREAAELAKRMRNEPDEDGFVTVTRGGSRAAPARTQEAEEAKQRMLEKEQKKKDELSSFYRYQMNQRRKAEQAEQIRKFQEDRKKVDALREKKGKFKPET
ncbi:putative meiotic recombination protein dmc1 protein [Zalerion maritima]|uniref:Meiotic recombination protein dmc1 protein n=1 Tax=Zalerion maritima TaxID=339359 RepID=A0AAD5RMV0_9PEZI|nr:putative meiotic recombination protein dmc1 protein [Zalerion maritima]